MIFDEDGIILEYGESKKRKKGKRLRKFISDYTLFDLETTGGNMLHTEIIEIAAIKVRNNNRVDTFETLVKPKRCIPPEISELTGITNEMVSKYPPISQILPDFIEFIGNDILIGHNINSYDLNIIYDLAEDLLDEIVSNDFVDTYDLSKCLNDLDLPHYNLETLCKHFNVTNEEAHRALSDVIANHKVYQKMKKYKIGYYKSPLAGLKESLPFKCAFDVTGKRICLTGEFICATRNEIENKLKQLGAKVTRDVSKLTNILVIGDLGTTTEHKIDKAKAVGADIIYEKDFIILE